MAGLLREPKPTNHNWLDCDPTFAQEADMVVHALQGPAAVEIAKQLVLKYPDSPLAYTILAEGYLTSGPLRIASEQMARKQLQIAKMHLISAAKLAPRCPHIAFVLAVVLMRLGYWDKAVVECNRSLSKPEPTDPAWHCPFPKKHIDAIISSKDPKHRIALMRERIRRLRLRAKKGKRTAVPPEPSSSAPKWPPERVDLDRAHRCWSSMSEEERQAFLTVSFEDMKSYCLSGGLPEKVIRVLSGAEEFVNGCGTFSYWICPLCSIIISADAMEFMSHIENFHIEDEYKKLWSSMPERIPDSEKELLKLWRWEPKPSNGDDLAERTEILSEVKKIVFQLIDMKAISLCLLFIIHKFIMSRVRPVTPLVVSMCACCGIGQLSSAHLKELYEFLQKLTPAHTDYGHQKAQNGEESQQDSLIWSKETGTLYFDCGKIASRKTDGSSQADELFDSLFCKPLLGYPFESWVGVTWRKRSDRAPEILNKISEELDKRKLRCSSCGEKKIQGGVYFLPKAIFESDIDVEPYFSDGIGSVQVEMLLIDAEVDYQKKRLLEACKVDYLVAILPIAKACLRAKLNNNPPEKVLHVRSRNGLELQAPLDVILRSLWHIRRFHGTLQKIPRKCSHVTVGDFQIGTELREIFDSWDDEKDFEPCGPSGSTRFTDLISCLIDKKDGKRRTATEIVELIFGRLHSSQTPLHFEFKGETLEQQTPTEPSLLSCICLTHDLFGLHIYENKCNSVNEVHTKFGLYIDFCAVGKTKLDSFSELLVAMESWNGSSGHKIARYSLLYPPHLFMTVFEWKDIEVSHINMHEVLISLATDLDISHIYGGLHSGCMYTLVSAVCCDDQGQYRSFARDKNRWIVYGEKTVEPAESWQVSIERYRQANLHPEILFFEHGKDK